mgnify:CR=1 FL=1
MCARVRVRARMHRMRTRSSCRSTPPAPPPRRAAAPHNPAPPNRSRQVADSTPTALRQLLRYLYTDELKFSEDVILDVMLLAQKMLIPRVLAHGSVHVRHNLK